MCPFISLMIGGLVSLLRYRRCGALPRPGSIRYRPNEAGPHSNYRPKLDPDTPDAFADKLSHKDISARREAHSLSQNPAPSW